MAKRDETEFGEYLAATAAPVPVFGWPEIDTSRWQPARPSLLIALLGLTLGLAIGFIAAWPRNSLVYPGTQVAAWMGTPAQALQATSGQPVVLQSTGNPDQAQPASALQNPRDPQATNFSMNMPGYLDQVPGQYLQGSANIPPK